MPLYNAPVITHHGFAPVLHVVCTAGMPLPLISAWRCCTYFTARCAMYVCFSSLIPLLDTAAVYAEYLTVVKKTKAKLPRNQKSP